MRRPPAALLALLILVALWCGASAPAAGARLTVARTPPMGWNPWYEYGCDVDEHLIEQTAQLIVSSGYAAAGYRYVNLDDCWMAPQRSRDGQLQADPGRFPSGIPALAGYVHSLGLKFGVYLDAGTKTCLGLPGSQDHYAQDARTLASWGVDFVKVDFCNTAAPPRQVYWLVSHAFASVQRQMLLSICDWGKGAPWRWAPSIASMWRTTGDYTAFGAPEDWWGATLKMADADAGLSRYAHPGAWNDPDILLAGTGLLSTAQARAQTSLWSMMAAPMLMDAGLATVSAQDAAVLRNAEVIAVDQDPAGRAGRRVTAGSRQLWVRPLADGSLAVLLLNAGPRAARMSVAVDRLGLPPRRLYTVRDLWAHRTREAGGTISVLVPGGDVAMLRVSAPPAEGTSAHRRIPRQRAHTTSPAPLPSSSGGVSGSADAGAGRARD